MKQRNIFWAALKRSTQFLFLTLLIAACASMAEAQVLSITSAPTTVAESDHTALGGEMLIWATGGGLIESGNISISFGGMKIVNTVGTGITALGATASVDELRENVNLFVLPGNGIVSISGLRFDIAGSGARSVTAAFSAPQDSPYSFTAGATSVPVISTVVPGLNVAAGSDSVIVIEPGTTGTATGRFTIVEGYRGAFTDENSIGNAGQNVASFIKIHVEEIPDGVTIIFPDIVISPENGARLTVLANHELVLPTSSGDNTITYSYLNGEGASIETFPVNYLVNVSQAPSETAMPYMQATLLQNDSEKIPYYDIQYMPLEDDLPFPQYELPFPVVMAQDQYMGIALTNTSDRDQDVTLTLLARNGQAVSGANITNPVVWTVPAGAQKARAIEDPELFGSGILNSSLNLGTIVAKTKRTRPVAFSLTGNDWNTTLDGAIAARSPMSRMVFPYISGEGESPYTELRIFNPSASAVARLTIIVRDSSGIASPVTSPEISLQPRATLVGELASLVSAGLSGITNGYIEVTASTGVYALEVFGNSADLNIVNAQAFSAQQLCWIPHFALGGGYATELDLIALDQDKTAAIRITAYNDTGSLLAGTGTVRVLIDPLKQKTLDVATLLGISSSQLTVGSLLVEVEPFFIGPMEVLPNVGGAVRFKSIGTGFSAVLPLKLASQKSTTYAQVAENATYWTGLAVLNPQATDAIVTVEVFKADGNLTGIYSFGLGPHGRSSKLLPELVSTSQGQQGGYFRVSSPSSVVSLALFGDRVFQSLAAIPAQ